MALSPRPPRDPGRMLALVWALLLVCVFPGCDTRDNATPLGRTVTIPESSAANTVTGRVFDEVSGRDLSGATVSVVGTGATTTTSAPGRFRLPGLGTGSFRLEVSRAGFNTRTQGVLLHQRGTLALDVGLMPSTTTGTFAGRVLDATTGDPIANVRVTVPLQGTPLTVPNSAIIGSAITDADGRFSIPNVGAGRTFARLESATHRPIDVDVQVPAGGATDITFRLLLDTGFLIGRVTSTRGSAPVTNALVSLLSSSVTALTNANGEYRIGPLPAGSYAVEFSAPSHDRRELVGLVLTGRDSRLDVELRFNLAQLSGTVRDSANQPLANATVSVPALNVTTRTGADGRYDFGLTLRVPDPPVPLGISASAQGFASGTAFVTLTPGQSFVQDFQLFGATGNLVGIVVDQGNGNAVNGAIVSIPALNIARITAIPGTFTFFAIPAQVHQVNVVAAGFSQLTTFVPVLSGRTTSVRLSLSP